MGWREYYYGLNKDNDDSDQDNGDSENSTMLIGSIDCYFRQLSEKRASVREEALAGIVKVLVHRLEERVVDFVENNFVTLVYHCLWCIRKSRVAEEMENAVYIIGLVAMITEYVDTSHEVYVDVFSAVSNGLKSKVDVGKVLECLAIVTFFGAKNSDETEKAMQLIWSFILPESNSTMKKKHPSDVLLVVLPVAISAWTFLLTTLDGWRLSYKIWQGASSCFSNLLNSENESVCAAAHEALALISESNCLEKFSPKAYSEKLHLSIAYNQKSQTYCETINGRKLKLSSRSQIIQMKYLRQFLGEDGFVKHMMKNENFHDIFEFSPKTENSCDMLYEPEREKVQVRYFHRPVPIQQDNSLLPFVSRENRQILKRMTKSSNSSLSKARTALLKKKRSIQDGENNPFAVDEE
ncbi:SALT-TOLERANCE 32 [Hibiscus trionum]|uniref:SALT-TOLERANCE 32 n=1 Tax=Hibiscus trionum TaxID=183268 RepID=A0A9W7J0V6_HIBTR|nr:SALT-TOLERANCE 32 [Hibiscus trionum]